MTPWSPPNVTHDGPDTALITHRQAQVLDGITLGLTAAQIGRHLHLSEQTVKVHLRGLYRALGARSQSHAVALAAWRVAIHVDGRRR